VPATVVQLSVFVCVQSRVTTATPAEVLQYLSAFTQKGLQTAGGSALCSLVLARLETLLSHRLPTQVLVPFLSVCSRNADCHSQVSTMQRVRALKIRTHVFWKKKEQYNKWATNLIQKAKQGV
jgi:hypothetical protein